MSEEAADAEYRLAEVLAATGQSAASEEALKRAGLLRLRSEAGSERDKIRMALRRGSLLGAKIRVEQARLDWGTVRSKANELVVFLDALRGDSAIASSITSRRQVAHRALMVAALAQGDYPAARRALEGTGIRSDVGPRATDTMQERFDSVGWQLSRIHVLFRAGEAGEARKVLDNLWPEIEAVFARAPDEVFNQIRMAEALRIKAEVAADLDAAARRALLERAAGYLRPAAAAGKLTRFEREVLLAEIEAGLAGRSS